MGARDEYPLSVQIQANIFKFLDFKPLYHFYPLDRMMMVVIMMIGWW